MINREILTFLNIFNHPLFYYRLFTRYRKVKLLFDQVYFYYHDKEKDEHCEISGIYDINVERKLFSKEIKKIILDGKVYERISYQSNNIFEVINDYNVYDEVIINRPLTFLYDKYNLMVNFFIDEYQQTSQIFIRFYENDIQIIEVSSYIDNELILSLELIFKSNEIEINECYIFDDSYDDIYLYKELIKEDNKEIIKQKPNNTPLYLSDVSYFDKNYSKDESKLEFNFENDNIKLISNHSLFSKENNSESEQLFSLSSLLSLLLMLIIGKDRK